MRSLNDTDKIVKEIYSNAEAIYSLSRSKASFSNTEKIINAAVFLFTPFIRGVKTANALSDFGIYYLVEDVDKQLLVRIAKLDNEELVQEKNILKQFVGKDLIIEEDKFEKIRQIQKRN